LLAAAEGGAVFDGGERSCGGARPAVSRSSRLYQH